MAAWKETPQYRVRILDSGNKAIAESPLYTATPNANGSTSANLTSARTYELPFDITQKGNYIISFTNNGSGFDEFLLLECRINADVTQIEKSIFANGNIDYKNAEIYNEAGIRLTHLQKGLNIIVLPDGATRKILK